MDQTVEAPIRHDWSKPEVEALFALPYNDLLFKAHMIHRQNFDPNEVQISTLLNIKTGACPEDCKYCSQSARYKTGLQAEKLMPLDEVIEKAKAAKASGATRFCMGAAWRSPKEKDLDKVVDMVSEVKNLGMETCVTLGMLDQSQCERLKDAGLDYYNHNVDTSPEHYADIITTRTFQDRLDTLANVREAGINVCCGGILGMGEDTNDRASMLMTLANLPKHPESVPINMLIQIKGTPLENAEEIDAIDFIRTIAVARIIMPKSMVRLSAGRESMSDEMQAACFFAGANSMFYGERLLTTDNPTENHDRLLFERLGLNVSSLQQTSTSCPGKSAEHNDRVANA